MGLFPVSGPETPVVITSIGKYGLGIEMAALGTAAPTSSGIPLNSGRLTPIFVPSRLLVQKLFRLNGTIGSPNFDMGIYDANYTLLVSSGSVAWGSASAVAEHDITDTVLERGPYYLAIAADAAASSSLQALTFPATSAFNQVTGGADQASAFPLPATMTPVALLSTSSRLQVPILGLVGRPLAA